MLDPKILDLLHDALLGDEAATQLNAALIETLHVWDDLIDRDVPVSDEAVMRAFRLALVVIPGNTFYQRHFATLHPLIDNLIVNWLAANTLERTPQDTTDLQVAFVIRSDYCNFLLKSMLLVGGFDHAAALWPQVRRFWHREGFAHYIERLNIETAAREGSTENVLQ